MYLRSSRIRETILPDVMIRGRLKGFSTQQLIRLLGRLEWSVQATLTNQRNEDAAHHPS